MRRLSTKTTRTIVPAVLALLVSACGGGTDEKEKFDGDRISVCD